MEKTPLLLRNTFLINTEGSYEAFAELSEYHDNVLLAHISDPFVHARYDFYHPFQVTFNSKFLALKSAGETQQGNTKQVREKLFDLQSNLIGDWDDEIRKVYGRKTDKYKSLFPNGHDPYQTGSQKHRIDAVGTLLLNIGDDAALAAAKAPIGDWYKEITDAQTTKVGKFSVTDTSSQEVEAARIAGCEAMWKNLMDFGSHFYQQPGLSAPFFNWEALHPGTQTQFIITVKPGTFKAVCKRTMTDGQTAVWDNFGEKDVDVFCTAKHTDTSGTTPTTLPGGEIKTLNPADMGNDKAKPWIILHNTQDTIAHVRLTLK